MATFMSETDDLWRTCPFDATHKVSKRRYGLHLNTCPKRKDGDWKQCPYNVGHRIKADIFQKHLEQCEDAGQEINFSDKECIEIEEKPMEFPKEKLLAASVKDISEIEDIKRVIIPGLHESLDVESIVDRFEENKKIPSIYAVQRLTRIDRKKLQKLLLEINSNSKDTSSTISETVNDNETWYSDIDGDSSIITSVSKQNNSLLESLKAVVQSNGYTKKYDLNGV